MVGEYAEFELGRNVAESVEVMTTMTRYLRGGGDNTIPLVEGAKADVGIATECVESARSSFSRLDAPVEAVFVAIRRAYGVRSGGPRDAWPSHSLRGGNKTTIPSEGDKIRRYQDWSASSSSSSSPSSSDSSSWEEDESGDSPGSSSSSDREELASPVSSTESAIKRLRENAQRMRDARAAVKNYEKMKTLDPSDLERLRLGI